MTTVDNNATLDVSVNDTDSTSELESLRRTLSDFKQRESELLESREQLENEFGEKRAKFKEIFLKKEDELTTASSECVILTEELDRVKNELEGVKTAAAMSEVNKQEDMKRVEAYYVGEIASLKQVIKGTTEEMGIANNEQKQELLGENEMLKSELNDVRKKLNIEREGFLLTVAKSIHKKVQSSTFSPNTSADANSLEDSMRRAQLDAEVLRSVVLPLEEEIVSLKARLTEAHNQMTTQKNLSLPDLEGKSSDEKIGELMAYLRAEKAARADLEMYVAVLNTQKLVLTEDTEDMKSDLEDVCSILEREKKGHEQLKQTWQAANDQFLESQRLMMSDLRHMEAVLSDEQHRQIAEQQRRDTELEAMEKNKRELSAKLESSKEVLDEDVMRLNEIKEKRQQRLGHPHVNSTENKSPDAPDGSEPSLSLSTDVIEGLKKSESGSQLSINSQDIAFLDSGVHETRSLTDIESILLTDSSCLLTEAQVKAIRDPTPESEARLSLLANVKARSDDGASLEGRRVVSDKEWLLLQHELKIAREKLGRPCDMCTNYETQLQSVQKELKEHYSRAQSLERYLENERQASANQVKYQTDLEHNLKEVADDAERQLLTLATKVTESEKYLSEVRQQYELSQSELYSSLKNLTHGREQIYRELGKLQTENETLLGKHSKHAQQVQAEDINLPDNLEGMQLLLLQYREDIIAAKVAKEYSEQTLHSQLLFVKDQLQSEQQEKVTIEEALTQEIAGLQKQAADCDSFHAQLDVERKSRSETATKLREAEQSLRNIQAKSKQLIHALQQQVEEQSSGRTQLEIEVQGLKSKIHSLQSDLDTSEAVQRDFVKLSQSLQIQLEKIRQAETEVRWQHEEDVEECVNCKQSFSVTKRKHHCRHCGKIFCSDCTSKSVNSGLNFRVSKVCDVCHTILVNDATPYFSTELPATPD